jgi:hypothetical protein
MLEIEIAKDTASPMLEELLAALEPERILAVAGKAAEVQLRQHFEDRNNEGNKQGWPSVGFWNRIRGATALSEVTPVDATITIADPAFNQKYYGGTITPKRGKYLALPANADAYRAGSPREGGGPGLTFAFGWDEQRSVWRPALVVKEAAPKGKRRKRGEPAATRQVGTVWYWLVKSVTQQADERALPDYAVMDQKVGDALSSLLDRVRERAA